MVATLLLFDMNMIIYNMHVYIIKNKQKLAYSWPNVYYCKTVTNNA